MCVRMVSFYFDFRFNVELECAVRFFSMMYRLFHCDLAFIVISFLSWLDS